MPKLRSPRTRQEKKNATRRSKRDVKMWGAKMSRVTYKRGRGSLEESEEEEEEEQEEEKKEEKEEEKEGKEEKKEGKVERASLPSSASRRRRTTKKSRTRSEKETVLARWEDMSDYLKESRYSDVVIKTEDGRSHRLHHLVLDKRSGYLQDLFRKGERFKKSAELTLLTEHSALGLPFPDFDLFWHLLYSGHGPLPTAPSELLSLAYLFGFLEVRDSEGRDIRIPLSDTVVDLFWSELLGENVCVGEKTPTEWKTLRDRIDLNLHWLRQAIGERRADERFKIFLLQKCIRGHYTFTRWWPWRQLSGPEPTGERDRVWLRVTEEEANRNDALDQIRFEARARDIYEATPPQRYIQVGEEWVEEEQEEPSHWVYQSREYDAFDLLNAMTVPELLDELARLDEFAQETLAAERKKQEEEGANVLFTPSPGVFFQGPFFFGGMYPGYAEQDEPTYTPTSPSYAPSSPAYIP